MSDSDFYDGQAGRLAAAVAANDRDSAMAILNYSLAESTDPKTAAQQMIKTFAAAYLAHPQPEQENHS